MSAEHIRHWRIGDVEVARIVEVNAFEDNIAMLLKDETAEFVKQHGWLQPHFATAAGLMKISFQAFVLRSRGKNVMIDTCIGADRKREYDVFCNLKTSFLEDLAVAGLPRRQHPRRTVHAPAFRSCRLEHAPGGRTLGAHLPAGALPVRQAGVRALGAPARAPAATTTSSTCTIRSTRSWPPGWSTTSPRTTRSPMKSRCSRRRDIRPGHVSVLIRSQGQQAVITGDLMHHPIQLVEPLRPGNFDMDKPQGGRHPPGVRGALRGHADA